MSTKPFQHQTYTDAAPTADYHLVQPAEFPAVGSEEFATRMRRVGDTLRAHGVVVIYLVHGTFVGSDVLGIFGEIERFAPPIGNLWRRGTKGLVDAVMGDVANYSPQYAQQLEEALNRAGQSAIAVRRLSWSSENHHLGRADGAVRLIDELIQQDFIAGQRVLLWGHSHAGNVFALVTHLLSGDRAAIDDFFTATRIYAHRWLWGRGELPHWQRVREALSVDSSPLSDVALDFVTFGTPIRYGWNTDGYAKLLHLINHRPAEGLAPYRVPFPPRERDVRTAAHGDYVQQLGIAGTNFLPNLFSWRALLADRRLSKLLQPGLRKRDLLARLRLGIRVPESGTTLLVDYGPPDGGLVKHLAGHAVYTQQEWTLFHAEEVARRLYATNGSAEDV